MRNNDPVLAFPSIALCIGTGMADAIHNIGWRAIASSGTLQTFEHLTEAAPCGLGGMIADLVANRPITDPVHPRDSVTGDEVRQAAPSACGKTNAVPFEAEAAEWRCGGGRS